MGTDEDRREDARRETIEDKLDREGVICEDCGHRWVPGRLCCPKCGGSMTEDSPTPRAVQRARMRW